MEKSLISAQKNGHVSIDDQKMKSSKRKNEEHTCQTFVFFLSVKPEKEKKSKSVE